MAILQDPGSANASALDQYVRDALALLQRMSVVNKVASEGLETLTFMRSKYLQAMSDARSASPSTQTSSSGLGRPSPFSLTNSSTGPSPDVLQTPPLRTQSAGQPLPSQSPRNSLPVVQQDNAPTPNTLFNQFISQYAASPAPVQVQPPVTATADFNLDKLFAFDPALYEADPNAAWLTQPIDGGLEAWPHAMSRLEGETDFGDWKKMLGL